MFSCTNGMRFARRYSRSPSVHRVRVRLVSANTSRRHSGSRRLKLATTVSSGGSTVNSPVIRFTEVIRIGVETDISSVSGSIHGVTELDGACVVCIEEPERFALVLGVRRCQSAKVPEDAMGESGDGVHGFHDWHYAICLVVTSMARVSAYAVSDGITTAKSMVTMSPVSLSLMGRVSVTRSPTLNRCLSMAAPYALP